MLHTLFLPLCLTIALFFGSFSFTPPAFAHALQTNYAFDLMKADLSFTSTFSTGEPLSHGTVQIYAPDNSETPWQTLETDDRGHFSFLPDAQKPGVWTVQIGTEGHSDRWTIPVTARGIEFQGISEGLTSDIHYASLGAPSPWLGLFGSVFSGVFYLGYRLWRGSIKLY